MSFLDIVCCIWLEGLFWWLSVILLGLVTLVIAISSSSRIHDRNLGLTSTKFTKIFRRSEKTPPPFSEFLRKFINFVGQRRPLPPEGASAGKTLSDEAQCRAHHCLQPSSIIPGHSEKFVKDGEFSTSICHSQDFREISVQKILRNIPPHHFNVSGIQNWYLQYKISDICCGTKRDEGNLRRDWRWIGCAYHLTNTVYCITGNPKNCSSSSISQNWSPVFAQTDWWLWVYISLSECDPQHVDRMVEYWLYADCW